jgi:hypothetical protein
MAQITEIPSPKKLPFSLNADPLLTHWCLVRNFHLGSTVFQPVNQIHYPNRESESFGNFGAEARVRLGDRV